MEQTAYLSSFDEVEDSAHFIDEETLLPRDLLCEQNEQQETTKPFMYLLNGDTAVLVNQMKTHRGSIFLQNLFEEMPECYIQALLEKLSPFLIELMCSHYGNYFIQKLFLKLTINQRLLILEMITSNFILIATDNSGTHSIQALIEVLKTPKEQQIFETLLEQNLLLLFNNRNSNHIIQKIIIDYPEAKRLYINRFFIENIDKIIINENGLLCAFKFVMMNTTPKLRIAMIQATTKCLNSITSSNSGCSFVLFLIEKLGYAGCSHMITEIKQNMLMFVNKKCFSLIIERLIDMIYVNDHEYFLNIINVIFTNDKYLVFLCQSQYGIKMIFSCIKHLNQTQRFLYKKAMEERCVNWFYTAEKEYILKVILML